MRRMLAWCLVALLSLPIVSIADENNEPLGWAQIAGGFDEDLITGHVILDDSTVVVAGKFTSAALFDEIGIGSVGINGDSDMFIATLNASGNWTSAYNFGSQGDDGIDSITLHPSGDLIVVGHFCLGTAGEACEMNLSTFTLDKAEDDGEGDAFVGRFSITNESLEPIWARTISNAGDLSGFDVEISPNGGVTAAVFHKANLDIEGQFLPGSDGTNIAILHYDENGAIVWSNGITSPDGIEIFGGMCYSSEGYLHIAGTYFGSIEFIEREESSGGTDIFVAQIDGNGNFTWTAFAGGTGEDWANDCAVDSTGYIHIVGQIEDSAQFGFTNLTSNGWRDMFHAKISSGGVWNSAQNAGGGGWEHIESLVIDSKDNVIVVGTYTSAFTLGVDHLIDRDSNGEKRDVFVAQLDRSNQWAWAVSAGGTGDDVVHSLQFGENETPIIGMTIQETAQMGLFNLSSLGFSDIVLWNYARDQDSDGIIDGADNCPRVANPDQVDTDGDLYGDACDDDDDGDSIGDDWDDCSPGEIDWNSAPNTDHDSDGCRDFTEDDDDDNDGILDIHDNCSKGSIGWISTIENDENQDGCEDVDTDGDGYVDQLDKCPSIFDNQADLDGDGIGDACETDTDGDGISDEYDNCPRDSFDWESEHDIDHDQDGCRDLDRDPDDDGDNVLDLSDECPLGQINWNASFDHDSDGCHDDFEDTDDDSDGFADPEDACPRGYVGIAGVGMDLDQDGCIDLTEDDDDDNDGVLDEIDECRYTPIGFDVDGVGCSGVQLDTDGDGVHNLNDLCPSTEPGAKVSSTGCVEKTQNESESVEDEEETSYLIWILFGIAGILVAFAAYLTFKPQQPLPNKTVPKASEENISSVNNGRSQGESSTASTDVGNAGLNLDTTEA